MPRAPEGAPLRDLEIKANRCMFGLQAMLFRGPSRALLSLCRLERMLSGPWAPAGDRGLVERAARSVTVSTKQRKI